MSFAKNFFRTIYKNDKVCTQLVYYKRYDLIKNFDRKTLNKLNKEGNTLLHEAAKKSDYKLTEELLKNDANKYIKNYYGDNVYDIAVAKNDYTMLRLLGRYNSNYNNGKN